MTIRTIEDVLSVDIHMALYDVLIKFTDSPILRQENDKFLCDVSDYVVIDGVEVRILDIVSDGNYIEVVRLSDHEVRTYSVENLKLIGFTLDNEPILEYNV